MRRAAPIALAVAGALVLLTFSRWSPERFWISVAIQILILSLFAMSLDLLVGYGGMPSLGHAAFFGVGAYAFALVAKHVTASALIALPAAALAAGLAALVIGVFCVRAIGIFFLMLTLAFAQMLYALAFDWIPVTGGSDGLSSVPRPDLGIDGANLFLTPNFYVFVAAVVLFCGLALVALTRSSFGLALAGVRENERRMRALGYDTTRIRLAAFVAAGAFAGVAGALHATFDGFVLPADVFVTTSVAALVMVLVGGAGTLAGPVLGATVVELMRTFLSGQSVGAGEAAGPLALIAERWESLLGLLFVGTVLFAPRGLIGVARRGFRAWPRSS